MDRQWLVEWSGGQAIIRADSAAAARRMAQRLYGQHDYRVVGEVEYKADALCVG